MPVDLTQFSGQEPQPTAPGSVDLSQFGDTGPAERTGPQTAGQELGQGLRRGTAQTAQLLFGMADLAGSILNSDPLREWAQGGLEAEQAQSENFAATIAGLDNIDDGGDFLTWAAGTIGEQIPNLAAVLGTGGVGASLARASLKSALRTQLTNTATRGLMGRIAAGQIAPNEVRAVVARELQSGATQRLLRGAAIRGAGAGAAISSFTLNTGDIQNELLEAGIDAPATALVGGALAGALDAAPVVLLLDRLFPGMDRALSKGFVMDIAKTMGLQTAVEGSTEAAQEAVLLASRAFHDPTLDITSESSRERILEAAAAGALVGAVTGGFGAAAAGVPRAASQGLDAISTQQSRLQDYVNQRAQVAQQRAQVAEEQADTAVPGVSELRTAAHDAIRENFMPAATALREQVAAGVQQARDAIGSASLGIDVSGTLNDVEDRMRTKLGPVMNEATQFVNQRVSEVRDNLAAIPESERAQHLKESLDTIRQQVKEISARASSLIQEAQSEFVQETETRNYDDEETFVDQPDPDEVRDVSDFTRVTFGKPTKQVSGAGADALARSVRPRGDDATPYTTREDAEAAADRVRESFPDIQEDAVFVQEAPEGGFVIAVADAVGAEEIFAQLRFADGVRAAAESSRGNPDKARRISVQRPGVKGKTNLDLPTLALAGQDLIERQGGTLPENRAKRAVLGVQEIIGRMLDQGFEIDMGQLRNKKVMEGLGFGQAMRQTTFTPEQTAQGREADLVRTQADIRPEGEETQTQTAEEIARPTERQQAQESARQRGPQERQGRDRAGETRQWHRNTTEQVRVGLLGASEEINARVKALVTELTELAGLRNRVIVVDAQGAQSLRDSGHPLGAQLDSNILDDPAGRIDTVGNDAVIYLSPKLFEGDADRVDLNITAVLGHEIGHLVEFTWFRQASPELRDSLKKAHEDSGSDKVFEEWMADQFVGWGVRRREPTNAVERFFARVADVMQRMLSRLRERFGLNESYREFMDGVRDAVTGHGNTTNVWGQYFLNEGVVGHSYFQLPENRNFDINDLLPDTRLRAKVKSMLNKYPGARQSAARMWKTTLTMHDMLTASLNGTMRRIGERVPAFNKIADIFNQTPGEARDKASYYGRRDRFLGLFATEFNKILRNKDGTEKLSDSEKQAVLDELISGEITSDTATSIRGVFDQMFEYMQDAGLPVQRIEDYFPRVWDPETVREAHDEIVDLLQQNGLTAEEAETAYDHMANRESIEGDIDPRDGDYELPFQGFLQRRAKVLDDPAFNKFRSRDLDRTLERYLNGVVKRAEFNRALGEPAEDIATWNPRGRLDEIKREAIEQGATQRDFDTLDRSLDAYLGRTGRDLDPEARKLMAWVATYQNVRLLLFSVLASFPDVVGPAVRSNDFSGTVKTFRDNMSAILNKDSDLNETARVWGIISDKMNQHILTEQFDNHWFPERARKINETFFRAIGLERWTNFTRAAALAVGRDSIKKWAGEGNDANLAELGLTSEQVRDWIDRGEPVSGSAGYESVSDDNAATDSAIADALVQFVNESIMRPNPSQRPLWASNPAFMLLFHLKSFMYSFHDTITRRLINNFQKAGTPWEKAYVVAMPAMMMMAMTAAGLELRELIQYGLWGRTPRTDRMETGEYLGELLTRSGIFGPAQLALDWEGADQRGQLPALAVAGPTLAQLGEFVSRPTSQTIPKALPVIGQIPPARDLVRDVTPL